MIKENKKTQNRSAQAQRNNEDDRGGREGGVFGTISTLLKQGASHSIISALVKYIFRQFLSQFPMCYCPTMYIFQEVTQDYAKTIKTIKT